MVHLQNINMNKVIEIEKEKEIIIQLMHDLFHKINGGGQELHYETCFHF